MESSAEREREREAIAHLRDHFEQVRARFLAWEVFFVLFWVSYTKKIKKKKKERKKKATSA